MKHKHADLIHAWADGAEIQIKNHTGWMDIADPAWLKDYEYRIKPEEKKPVVRWLWVYKSESELWRTSMRYMTESEATCLPTTPVKLEWSRTEFPE